MEGGTNDALLAEKRQLPFRLSVTESSLSRARPVPHTHSLVSGPQERRGSCSCVPLHWLGRKPRRGHRITSDVEAAGWDLHPGIVSVSAILTFLCRETRGGEWGVRSCIFTLICKEILKHSSLKLPFMAGGGGRQRLNNTRAASEEGPSGSQSPQKHGLTHSESRAQRKRDAEQSLAGRARQSQGPRGLGQLGPGALGHPGQQWREGG